MHSAAPAVRSSRAAPSAAACAVRSSRAARGSCAWQAAVRSLARVPGGGGCGGGRNQYLPTPWPAPYDSVGALRNRTTEQWQHRLADLEAAVAPPGSATVAAYRAASAAGDPAAAAVLAGEGVGLVEALGGAEAIVRSVEAEAVAALSQRVGAVLAAG